MKYPRKLKKKLKKMFNDEIYKNIMSGELEYKSNYQSVLTKSGWKTKYIGKEFYPHIVRSFFATHETKQFLKNHKTATKKEVQEFLLYVAEKLGHRKFNKKENEWKNNYTVTLHSYIAPNLAKKLTGIIKKNGYLSLTQFAILGNDDDGNEIIICSDA
jgi:hypothetical protein